MGGGGAFPEQVGRPAHCRPRVKHGGGGGGFPSPRPASTPEAWPTLEVTVSNLHESLQNERLMKTHTVPDMLALRPERYTYQLLPPPPMTQQVLSYPFYREKR